MPLPALPAALLLFPCAQAEAPSKAPEPAPWTFLIYGAADNNADGHMFRFIADVRAALAPHAGVEVALFMDRHAEFSDDAATLGEDFTGGRLYRLTGGKAERLDGAPELPLARLDGEWEADSGDPAVLGAFVRWGKRRFPAQRTALLVYSHADGLTMCPDEATETEISLADFPERAGAGAEVDWTGLELCNMGGFESAYSWRPGNGGFSTEILVAIPNAGPALDWARILKRFTPGMEPAELGRLAVEEGGRGRLAAAENPEMAGQLGHESVACYDLARIADAKLAWDRFAAALSAVPEAERILGELRGPGPRGTAINYCDGSFKGEHAFVDAVDLARRAAGAEDLPEEARSAAERARAALDEVVLASFAMDGYEGFVHGENGICVAFPDGTAKGGSVLNPTIAWSRYRWLPASPFGRDGATPGDGKVTSWFELLDLWFDKAEGGGVNGVKP